MELTGLGGGLMVAIAAALWLLYLVPNWFKRREYLATERNAVRLQQTIRVLAETAEVPAAVRAEAAARRLAQEQRAEFREGPVSVGRAVQRPARPDPRALAARRLRRTRALTTLVLFASLVVFLVQLSLFAVTTAGSWFALAAAGVASLSCVAMLGRLAATARSRAFVAPAAAARRTSLGAARAPQAAPQAAAAEWTPVAVPKPLYLSRPEAPAAPARDTARELELAAAAAERALRAAERETVPVAPAARSGFAAMGIVDDATSAVPDIDAVLARRRAG